MMHLCSMEFDFLFAQFGAITEIECSFCVKFDICFILSALLYFNFRQRVGQKEMIN